ncbi:MAG: hypothetical protein R3E96_00175 [Planctomycetota bacterium]
MTNTIEASRPTHCPTCGVKLPDIPVSLCAYCASPVMLAEKVHGGAESPNASRIARIPENKSYQEVLTHRPPETPDYRRGLQGVWHGRNLAILGVLSLGAGYLTGSTMPWTWIGAVLLILGATLWYRGLGRSRRALAEPLTKRHGMIVDRRSETSIKEWSGHTVYYFSIEFEGGAVGEYRYEGRGANEDPYPTV